MQRRTQPTSRRTLSKPKHPVIAVDFDGVLHDAVYTPPKMGPPKHNAKEAMQELIDRGYRVVVFTSRAATPKGVEAVRDWLDYYDILYHGVTAVKIPAVVYIDDRAIRFTTWPDTMTQLDAILSPLMLD
jgi:trehalose-6-phosphatase